MVEEVDQRSSPDVVSGGTKDDNFSLARESQEQLEANFLKDSQSSAPNSNR